MKKIIRLLIVAGVFIALAAFHFCRVGEETQFDVKDGATGAQIGRDLKSKGVIQSPLWFKIVLKLSGAQSKIKPGRYLLRKKMSSEEVVWRLLNTKGTYYIKLVVPEGWRMEQIAERLDALKITSEEEFLNLAKEKKLEGYLFPSTYFFEEHTPAATVIELMAREFENHIRPLFKNYPPMALSEREILTIASIVEREAVIASERPLIAAVYLNRIKRKMALEADPTVQYAIGYYAKQDTWWKKGLTYKDLKTDSPYNTYKYASLPPGPICNPSYGSVEGVFHPAAFDSLYFVADGKNKHVFNTVFAEHVKAKNRIAKEAAAEKAAAR